MNISYVRNLRKRATVTIAEERESNRTSMISNTAKLDVTSQSSVVVHSLTRMNNSMMKGPVSHDNPLNTEDRIRQRLPYKTKIISMIKLSL